MLPKTNDSRKNGRSVIGTFFMLVFIVAATVVASRLAGLPNGLFAERNAAAAVVAAAAAPNAVSVDLSLIEELFESISEKRLSAIVDRYQKEYARNLPFPHIAVDGVFPPRYIAAVEQEIGEGEILDGSGCHKGATKCFKRRNSRTELKKSSVEHEDLMGPYTRILFGAMKSSNFIHFLEQLTSIDNIIPDPHYRGSGLHFTSPGGYLGIHADFNKYEKFNLDRRVNAFVFLNKDWKEEYGGHLELWNREMTQCSKRVIPTLGRLLVFSTTDFSYHGHPNELTAPPGKVRRSMALYYYSNGRPSEECLDGDCSGEGHTTLFQVPKGCSRCEEQSCRAYKENEAIPFWVKAS